MDLDVRAKRHPRVSDALVRRYAVAEERADRGVLEQLAVEGRREREDADHILRRRARSARADAAIDRDVSRAEVQWSAHASLRRAARAARVGGAPASALQAERRDRMVREVRDEAAVHLGESARRGQEGHDEDDGPAVGRVGQVSRVGQVGQVGRVSQVGRVGRVSHVGRVGRVSQVGRVGRVSQVGR